MRRNVLLILFALFINMELEAQYLSGVRPNQNQVLYSAAVQFAWNTHPDAVSYTFTLSRQADLSNPEVVITQATNTLDHTLLHFGQYYWQVMGTTATGTNYFSGIHSFTHFTPSLLPGLSLWLDAADAVTDGAQRVSVWTDKSGQGNHVSQATLSDMPVRQFNTLNGNPAITFNGTTQFLDGGNILNFGTSSQAIFVVARALKNNSTLISKSLAGGVPSRYALIWEGANLLYLYQDNGGRNISAPFARGNFGLITISTSRAASLNRLFANGLQIGQNTISPTHNFISDFNFLIGAYNNATGGVPPAAGFHHQGEIAEVLMYFQDFTPAQRITVENYLRKKYFPSQFIEPVSLGFDIVSASFCPVTLDAGERFVSYQWSTGETTRTISVTRPGTYSVTVTDIFGVQSTDQIVVTFPTTALSDTSPNLCVGDTRTIFPLIPSPELYTFMWSTGETTHAIDVGATGSYWVRITDSFGCSALSDTLHLTVDNFRNTVSLGPDISLCAGNTISLISPPSGVGITGYLWNTGAITPSITVLHSGTYTLTVTNVNGCVATDTILVDIIGTAPVADFAATEVCLGSPTIFTDMSVAATGDNLVSWQWSFGGEGSSTEQHPQFVFDATGTYLVTLVTTSTSGCSQQITKPVEVKVNPTALFTVQTACIGVPYQFTDVSTPPAGGAITGWQWYFGDGNTSPLQSPAHTFGSAGIFNMSLIATAQNLCTDTLTIPLNVVATSAAPAPFTMVLPKNNAVMHANMVQFQTNISANASTYNLLVARDAAFNDIIINTPINPIEIATRALPPGRYYAKVVAANICMDTESTPAVTFHIFDPATISNLALWLTASNVVSDGGAVSRWTDLSPHNHQIVQNTPALRPTTVANGIGANPVVRFNGAQFLDGGNILNIGTSSRTYYLIGRINTGTGTFFSKAAAANVSNRYGLFREGVNFQFMYHDDMFRIVSTPFPSAEYTFFKGVSNRTIAQNRLYINNSLMGTAALNPTHNFVSNFNFLVGAYANSAGGLPPFPGFFLNGDIAEIMIFDRALSPTEDNLVLSYLQNKYSPPVNLGPDIHIDYGFCPVALDAGERFVSYLWSTGETTRTIEVNMPGTYTVTVTDIFGMRSTDDINVTFPQSRLNQTEVTLCQGDSTTIAFDAGFGGRLSLRWNTGATTPSIVVKSQGTYTLTVTDTLGCSQELSARVVVDFFATRATLGQSRPFCIGDELGLLIDGQVLPAPPPSYSYLWSTGATTPTITITQAGDYSLTVTNENGCVATPSVSLTIQGHKPLVSFEATTVCFGEATVLTDLSTVQGSEITGRVWHLPDTPGVPGLGAQLVHTFAQGGWFPVTLEVVSAAGCRAGITQSVQVYRLPRAWFTPNNACTNVEVQFNDASTDPEGGIAAWQWSFYDNAGTLLHASQERAPRYTFNKYGNMNARLVVTSGVGCRDTVSRVIDVRESPNVNFNFTTPCLGSPVFFTDLTTSPAWARVVSQQWNFGDGRSSSQSNPSHLYQQAGVFDVTLTVTGTNGCRPSLTRQVTVHSPPVTDFLNPDICSGTPHTFEDISTVENSSLVAWQWNFGELGQATVQRPVWTFEQPGRYNVSLTTVSAAGCSSSLTKIVDVNPAPEAAFTIFPRFGAAPLAITFTNQSRGATGFTWDFGDGSLLSSLTNPIHIYRQEGVYNAQLTAISDVGCIATFGREIRIIPLSIDIGLTGLNYNIRNNYLEVSANLINLGVLEFDSLYLYFQIGGHMPVRELWTGMLNPGGRSTYTFRGQYPYSDKYDFFCISVMPPGLDHDDNPANDRLCVSFIDEFALLPPYPNPATDEITLGFILPWAGEVEIVLSDALGAVIDRHYRSNAPEGINFRRFAVSHLRSGVYVYRITFAGQSKVGKFILK